MTPRYNHRLMAIPSAADLPVVHGIRREEHRGSLCFNLSFNPLDCVTSALWISAKLGRQRGLQSKRNRRGLLVNKMIFCTRKKMELGFFFKSGKLLSLIMAAPTVLGAALVGFKAKVRRLSGIGEGIRSSKRYCDSF